AQGAPQSDGFCNVIVPAQETGLQPIQEIELLLRRERGVVGHVVSDPHELVEGQDDAAMARVDEPRRDREILVAMALSGRQCGGVIDHGAASSFPESDIESDIKATLSRLPPLRLETVVIPEFPRTVRSVRTCKIGVRAPR